MCSKLEGEYKELGKSREAKKKATQAKFKDMNKKWTTSENLVRHRLLPALSVVLGF
jgi:hypothetical protein